MAEKNSDFITGDLILRKVLKQEGVVTGLEVTNLCDLGQNYAAELKNAKFSFANEANLKEMKNKSVIFKYPNKSSFLYESVKLSKGYDKEVTFYGKLVPDVYKWQEEVFGSVKCQLPIPECFYCCQEDYVLAIENLNTNGFEMLPKQIGRNLEETKTLVKSLAILHGVLYSYFQSFNTEEQFFIKYPCLKNISFVEMEVYLSSEQMISNRRNIFKTILEPLRASYPEENQLIDEFIQHIDSVPYAKNTRYYYLDNEEFNVICHGDMWNNNVLYQKQEAAKIVDFQILKYASPATDLCHFLWFSASENVLEDHIKNLVQLYYDSLQSCVLDLKCSLPISFDRFFQVVESFFDISFQNACVAAIITYQTDEASMTAEIEGDNADVFESGKLKIEKLARNNNEDSKKRIINLIRIAKKHKLF